MARKGKPDRFDFSYTGAHRLQRRLIRHALTAAY